MKIKSIIQSKHLASLANETIGVTIELENGKNAQALVPAGISAGKYETKIVTADEAMNQIENIKDTLLENDWTQKTLDERLMDFGLGGNTSLAISAAFWKAISRIVAPIKHLKFPKLMVLLFEGGKHGNPQITLQEFMIIEESINTAISDFKMMRAYLEKNGLQSTVGAEGGFSPVGFNNQIVLETINKVFPQKEIAIDAAASFEEGQVPNYDAFLKTYNIKSIEDPFSDEEWEEWIAFCKKAGQKIMIVGDDLTTTNPERLQKAIDFKAINAVIIKPNQNGTITGTLEAVELARKNGLKVVVSHRGEETVDDWIVDFALNINADYVKFGGMNRGERIVKYNRLLELGMK
jgi:enolase